MPRPTRETPHGINIHIEGVKTAAHLADEKATGLVYNTGWQGVLPLEPTGQMGKPRGIVEGLDRFMPWVRVLRMPFNRYCFDANNRMRPNMEALLDEARLRGYRILWVLMEGISQRGLEWVYSPPPDTPRGSAHYRDFMFPQARIAQLESYTKLLAWLDANPGLAVEGFEAINEPAGYKYAVSDGGIPTAEAVKEYVDAVLGIWALVKDRHPGKDFYVGYWNYSESYAEFLDYSLNGYGGRTADQVFQAEIGNRLVYSFHSYFGLNASSSKPVQKDMHVRRIGQHMRTGTPISVTEIVTRNNHTDLYPWTESDSWSEFSRARWHHAAKALRQGSMWWPHMNWAKGFLIRHQVSNGQSVFRNDHMNSYGAAVAMMSFGNHPAFFRGPQSGIKTSASPDSVVQTVTGFISGAYQPDYDRDVRQIAHIFGGRGHCVLQSDPAAKNYLYGGDGRSVIYCSDNWDHAYLGRGGGVIRCGAGHCVAVAHEGRSLIYAGPGTTVASLWSPTQFAAINSRDNAGTVVAHPTGTLHVAYFYPEAGHKVSFRGAFKTPVELLAACSRELAPDGYNVYDLVVTLPTGGTVRLARMGSLYGDLHNHCVDLTAGWYAAGWQEPADYQSADLALAAPTSDQFDWWYEVQPNGTVTIVFAKSGKSLGVFGRNGAALGVRVGRAA